MITKLSSTLNTRLILIILLAVTAVIAGVCLGSLAVPVEYLTARRGNLAFIPRDYRLIFAEGRLLWGAGSAGVCVLLTAGWAGAEALARSWQRGRNLELAANAVLLRLAPRVDETAGWETAVDLWRALHSTLARPATQVWCGNGLHLSFEIAQLAGERLAFYLWAPRPLAETLVRQFKATYAGLEVEPAVKGNENGPADEMDDYLSRPGPNARWVWADLGLGGDPWLPLRSDFAVDPLVSLLSALEGLGTGDALAAMHIILRPATFSWQKGGREFIRKAQGETGKPGKTRPRMGGAERQQIKEIEAKTQGLGYDLCLRVLAAGTQDPASGLARLVRVFDQFAAANRLAVRGQGDGSQLYRLENRFFPAGWSKSVIGEAELAALAHLPNRSVTGVAVSRASARTERPSPVSFAQPGDRRVILGHFTDVPSFGNTLAPYNGYALSGLRRVLVQSSRFKVQGSGAVQPETLNLEPFTDHPVGVSLIDARRHFHVIGPTGVGKSTLLLRMVWQYLVNFPEASVWLQEPHQDLTHKIVKRVPLRREQDVIWLDVMDPARAIGVNPLEAPAGADLGALTADVMGVMKKGMGANWDTAVQMQEILENALLAVLSGEPAPMMVHLFKFLADADYRYDLTSRLSDPIAAPYWQSIEQKKERELDQMFSVPRRRINAFLRNPIVRRIVAQPHSTLDFRSAIDGGKVILVQLDGRMGAANREFIGSMMMYRLFGAVMSRMDIPEAERRQVAICVDEFQTFVGQSGAEFADILEQARKMGASLTLAHQHLGQLTQGGADLINSVANNTGTKVVFRAEAADAPTFLKWLPELKTREDLTTLGNFRCYVRPMVNGSPQPVCTLWTYADPPVPDPAEELRTAPRGTAEPLPAHPGRAALRDYEGYLKLEPGERKVYLLKLNDDGWGQHLAARRYDDAVKRNRLIEDPALIPDKLERIRALVRLGYGTPHEEVDARVEQIMR